MTPRIGLFANKDNLQLREIADQVAERGAEPVVLDIQVGGANGNTMAVSADGARWNGIDLDDVRAFHIRCTAPRTLPAPPPVLNAASHAEYRARYLREQEYQAATHAFFEALAAQGKMVVNRLTGAYVDHDSKGQFYEKLRENGFRAPRSLSTNDPEAARKFITEVGEAIVKPAIGIGSTRAVTEDDMERLDELRVCPALFQERAPGQIVRVHIVGDTVVLALRILSEGVDSRTGSQDFEYIRLDEGEEERIVQANRFLGLHYAAWDVIVDDGGALTYLDCNPGPFVMWIGPDFRRTVFGELAAYLIAFSRGGSVEEASSVVAPWRPS